MKKILLTIIIFLAATCAHAQTQTKSYLESLTTAQIPDNITGAVAPASVRTVLNAMIAATCTIGDVINCPLSAFSGLGTNVAALLAGPASGTGGPVGNVSPVLTTPNLGTPTALVLTNATGLPNAGLLNPSLTLGATNIALGATTATITGFNSITSTVFIGALTGHGSLDLPLTGGVLTGPLTLPAASGASAPLVLTIGSAPSGTPPNGVAWATSAGIFYQSGGATIGPLTGATQLPVLGSQQRLTLTSGTPYLVSPVSASATIYETPTPQGNLIPLWNGTAFVNTTCPETSNVLANSATGNAGPAAAVAASVYDLYEWTTSGACTLTRSPVWTNTTTRSAGAAQTRVNGIITNSVSITNGPAVGFGTFIGTMVTDAGGATVTFNPAPAPNAGGPTNGAWVGLWNEYNRALISLIEQDNTASWIYASATWAALDGSNNNRITLVEGELEDSVQFAGIVGALSGTTSNAGDYGVGFNSTSSPIIAGASPFNGLTSSINLSGSIAPTLGVTFLQALQAQSGGSSGTYYGAASTIVPSGQTQNLSALARY